MRWLLRVGLFVLAVVVLMPVVILVGLNTGAGRNFAAREINHFGAGQIEISGLGGHFPADLKIAHLAVADAKGVWLSGDDVQLRWKPWGLVSRDVNITALTAADIAVTRAPVAGSSSGKSSSGGLPNFKLDADKISIGALQLGASLAGQDVTLAVDGAAHLKSPSQGEVQLAAVAAHGLGNYQVTAAIGPAQIDAHVTIDEPPDGLIGHFAGPQLHDPLHVDLTLAGPREHAGLNFVAALGAAQINGAGSLGLAPDNPHADVTLNMPSLAPIGALVAQSIAGNAVLHVLAARQDGVTKLAVNGTLALTRGPGPAARLVGPDGHVALVVRLADGRISIDNLALSGAGFNASASGKLAASGFDLTTHLGLRDVAMLSPGIGGAVTEDGTIKGTAKDFAVSALLSGDVTDGQIPSGPFSVTIQAQNLPGTPHGTLKGSGALEGYPLMLDAQFARDASGVADILINRALWRSLSATAHVNLAEGETLPTGEAKFAIKRLADFSQFSPVPLAGAVDGDFTHQDAQDFTLDLNMRNLLVVPSIGSINATVNAKGPGNALAVKLDAVIAKLMGEPAHLASRAVVNLDAHSANISALAASWRRLNAKLLGPALVETKPGIAVRHLALGVNGGTVNLDGVVSPAMKFTAAVKNLPADLASLVSPGIKASGMLSATASVSGTTSRPVGNFTLDAADVKLHTGPAASLPAANLTASGALAGQTATINAKLGIGPNANMVAVGRVPLNNAGTISLHVTGMTDLRLLDPILAANGTILRGVVTPDVTITGTAAAPLVNGRVTLADGSVNNIGSGLNLTKISAHVASAGRDVTLQDFSATAGSGSITGHGNVNLGAAALPVDLTLNAKNATPISSDLATETLDAALRLTGDLKKAMALSGNVDIIKANINIPKSLPPSVADLPIRNRSEKPPPPPPPAPDINLDLTVRAKNQIFIRGDGLFAELGGRLHITGPASDPQPQGGFTLIRGNIALAGKTLQFTKGLVSFNGDGFIPTLDLEATTTLANSNTVSLVVGGTADKPTITLSGSPPLPSDEVLSELLFGQATTSLSPFQAASLAAALASLSGVGGSVVSDPLGGVRNALGLDELSLGGSGSGPPTVQAGRYVAPGVYVGAQQSTSGQGTQATVEINLYKGLKLNTATGTSGSGSGNSSSVGLTYQFNY
jgi:translocation and assembly module TamB